MLDEMREIIAGDGKSLAVRRVREALSFAGPYFPRLEIPSYPSDNDLIAAAVELVRQHESTFTSIDGTEWVMQRVPGETKAEFEERKKLFEDLQEAGGRIAISIEELPESVIERLRKQAVEHPDAEIEIVGGDGSGDLVTDLGLPTATRTLWALIRGIKSMIASMDMTPAEFARAAGLPVQVVQDLCDGRIGNASLERVIEMYDGAAQMAGKRTVAEMIDDALSR